MSLYLQILNFVDFVNNFKEEDLSSFFASHDLIPINPQDLNRTPKKEFNSSV